MKEETVLTRKSADFNFSSQFAEVLGSKMHYVEQGSGDPILFLHGMPTSSYLWRNVIPFVSPLGRCIALDLIGMGKSDKPTLEYHIEDHIRYVEAFIEAKKLKKVTLVMHGLGSVIGCDYAMRHESNCKGLVFYEGFLHSLKGSDFSLPFQEQLAIFSKLKNSKAGMVSDTEFLDTLMAESMMHKLTPEERSHYYEPYLQESPMAKLALQQYWQDLSQAEGKSKIDKIIEAYSKKLTKSQLPKLLLYSIPGFITSITTVMWAKENLPRLEVGEVGEELHFAQEAEPQLMGELMSVWLQAVEQQTCEV